MDYDKNEKKIWLKLVWIFIRLLVSTALCIIGFRIADILIPYEQYWSFGIMYILGIIFCCIDIYFMKDR